MNNTTNLSSLIWSSADDVLRNLFKPSEFGRVILPFVVMRRLDCVLEPKKDEVYELFTKYKDQLEDPSPVILRQVGLPFFNTSRFDLSRIKSDTNNVLIISTITSKGIRTTFWISLRIFLLLHWSRNSTNKNVYICLLINLPSSTFIQTRLTTIKWVQSMKNFFASSLRCPMRKVETTSLPVM